MKKRWIRGFFNKLVNFELGVDNKQFMSSSFSSKLFLMGPFMSQNTVGITFFIRRSARKLFFTRDLLSFWLRIRISNPCLTDMKTFFFFFFFLVGGNQNMLLRTRRTTQNLMHSFQSWSAQFDLPPFWIASKQIFLRDENDFCYKLIPNIYGKKKNNTLKKYLFCFFSKKKIAISIKWPTSMWVER